MTIKYKLAVKTDNGATPVRSEGHLQRQEGQRCNLCNLSHIPCYVENAGLFSVGHLNR